MEEKYILRNDHAREGDQLFLTKPIGTGILSAAMKRGKIMPPHEEALLRNLVAINTIGAELGAIEGVHAVTDVTGFGLLGHLIEMTEGSGLTAEIDHKKVPLLDGAGQYAAQFVFPDNTYRNWNAYEKKVQGVAGPSFITLCDPQTNGGLLISASPESIPHLQALFDKFVPGMQVGPIGRMVAKAAFEILVSE